MKVHVKMCVLLPALLCSAVTAPACGGRASEHGATSKTQAEPGTTRAVAQGKGGEQAGGSAAPRTLVEASVPPALAFEPLSGPGPAYFSVYGERGALVRLDAAGFERVHEEALLSLSHFALARDRTLWAAGVSGVYRVGEDALEAIDMQGAPKGVKGITVDPAGRVWIAGYEAIGRHDDQGWVTQPYADFDETIKHATSLAADARGHIYLGTMHAIYRWAGERWTAEDFDPLGLEAPLFGLVRGSVDGSRLVLGSSGGTLTHTGEGWQAVPWTLAMADQDLVALAPTGKIVQGSIDGRVAIAGAQELEQELELAALGVSATHIERLELDARGRLWMLTDNGLQILASTRELSAYPPGTVPELDGRIQALFVMGAGPEQLPQAGVQRTGTVTGQLIVDGEPLPDAAVELCPRPELMYRGESPCDGAPIHREARSDAQGRFRFEGVPRTELRLVFQSEAAWQLTLGFNCCSKLEPGAVLDLGETKYESAR